MGRPNNLSKPADMDLTEILYRSLKRFGLDQTKAAEDRICARCLSIRDGSTIGHKIDILSTRRPILYHYEHPWMIAFDPGTREIIRIFHARRDLAKLMR